MVDISITETVLVRSTSNTTTTSTSYYHPHCVCMDCNSPLMDPIKVPWPTPHAAATGSGGADGDGGGDGGDSSAAVIAPLSLVPTNYYHPDCCCQYCFQPFINGNAALEEQLTTTTTTTNSILATPPHRYTHYRFHKKCPKQKSPGYNVISCAACNGVIDDLEDMHVSLENQQQYHRGCIEDHYVFKSRLREAESNSYYDHFEHIEKIFHIDWQKMSKRKRFVQLLATTHCTNVTNLKTTILPYYEQFCDIYDMYGGFGRFDKNDPDDAFELQKNEVKQWAQDSQMIHLGTDCGWNRLYTFFLAANVEISIQEDSEGAGHGGEQKVDVNAAAAAAVDNDQNDDTSLVRFEFLLFIVMCAHARYYSQSSNDLISAVDKCFRHHVSNMKLGHKYVSLPQMDVDTKHPCVHRSNDFRFHCLYTHRVAQVLQQNQTFLMSVFAYYSQTRKNELSIDLWFDLIKDTGMIDQDSSERDVLLCFCYSRMRVRDEMHLRKRVTKLTFCEFLESLVRIAMIKSLVVLALHLKGIPLDKNKQYHPPMKWIDAGFKPHCSAVDRLAQQGNVPMWRSEDAGDRVDLLVRGMKHMFETKMSWNLHSKFKPLSKKHVAVLESRDTKNAKHVPQNMTKYQLFDPVTGRCVFRQVETKYVKGITVSVNKK